MLTVKGVSKGFEAALEAAKNRGKPFIAYAWRCNFYRDGQRDDGWLVVSLGEQWVHLTDSYYHAKGMKPPEPLGTGKVNIKATKYERDIEKLRSQGRLKSVLYGAEDGSIVHEEKYDDWGNLI